MAAASLVLGLAMAAPSSAAGRPQQAEDLRALLQRLERLEAAQAKVLTQLEAVERQRADLRRGPAPAPPAPPEAPVSIEGAPRKGSEAAGVVVIEYADFQCPFCAEFARRTLPELEQRYVATGKVQFVFRNFPLQEIHPQAVMAAETAACAGQQGRFWDVHDALFAARRLDEAALVATVRSAQVDVDRFSACVRGPGAQQVRQELAAARALGLAVTPTFLIGRRQPDGLVTIERVITGVRDAAAFAAVLDPMLDEAGSVR